MPFYMTKLANVGVTFSLFIKKVAAIDRDFLSLPQPFVPEALKCKRIVLISVVRLLLCTTHSKSRL